MLEFYAFDGTTEGLFRSDGTAAGTIELATNVDLTNPVTIGFTPQPAANDFNGDGHSDILWRNTSGAMTEWLMNGTTIVQSVVPNLGGTASSPDAAWSTQAKPTNFG